MLDHTSEVKMIQSTAKKGKMSSRWSVIRRHIRLGETKPKRNYRVAVRRKLENMELEARREYVMDMVNDPEVLRRLSLQPDSETQVALQQFISEMMETFAEINDHNRSDSIKKLKGIIKKTVNCETRSLKPKNTVHFSEENIYIEIPRIRKKKFDIVLGKCNYYCCFGFLFPI